MLSRCKSPSYAGYKDYGGRGIRVCERWENFENFLLDMGERPPGTSLDRINGNGNYEPGNCRWATPKQQIANSSRPRLVTFNGITRNLAEWSKETGVPVTTIGYRLRIGCSLERAFTKGPLWEDAK